MKILSVCVLAVLAYINAVAATKESIEACAKAVDVINENNAIRTDFKSMMKAYNETCGLDDLCTIDMVANTLNKLKNMTIDKDAEPPAIKGSIKANLGKKFKEHVSYMAYDRTCGIIHGGLDCLDANVTLQGTAGAAFFDNEQGIDMDFDVQLKSFPICLPSECEGEEMEKVFEQAAKGAFLKVPSIAEKMTAKSEKMMKSLTLPQVCILMGLETCNFEVESVGCKQNTTASIRTSGRLR